MPDFPDEIVTAAAIALHDLDCQLRDCDGPALGHYYQQARRALEAAAVPLGGYVAQAILRHRDTYEGGMAAERVGAWRRHFGIAARVAASAFLTEDDKKRLATDALVRGDFAACPDPAQS